MGELTKMPHYDWREDVVVKKKMILKAKRVRDNPLLISVSNEYEDEPEWKNQVKFWQNKYGHKLKRRHTLVKCTHIAILNYEVVPTAAKDKVFIFPREQLSPLTYDEIDILLTPPEELNNNAETT